MSAGGHIASGETSVEAAQKEIKEEIGLDLPASEFKLLKTLKQPRVVHGEDFVDDEFNDIYLVLQDVDISDLITPDNEVAEMRWIDLLDFENWTKGLGEPMVPHGEEYEYILNYLS